MEIIISNEEKRNIESLLNDGRVPDLMEYIGNIIHNQPGAMSALAKKTGLGRESLYKILSHDGNPRLNTFEVIINALGFTIKHSHISFEAISRMLKYYSDKNWKETNVI